MLSGPTGPFRRQQFSAGCRRSRARSLYRALEPVEQLHAWSLTQLDVDKVLLRATSMRTLHLHTVDDMAGYRVLAQPFSTPMEELFPVSASAIMISARVHKAGVKLLGRGR